MAYTIFADESGNTDLESDKKRGSPYFVVTCVIINDKDLIQCQQGMKAIVEEHCGQGELKSSNIGNKHERRLKILLQTTKIEFTQYSLVVDKRLLYGLGFKYKSTFTKFIYGMVFEKLFRTLGNVSVHIDQHGSPNFMLQFTHYLGRKQTESLLFNETNVQLVNSRDQPLIQLADLICGTISKIQSKTLPASYERLMSEEVNKKILFLDYWPPFKKSIVSEKIPSISIDVDYANSQIVKNYSVNTAISYITDTPTFDDKNEEIRIAVLRYLLMLISDQKNNHFIYSGSIIAHVKDVLGHSISVHYLTSNIISKLRDSGVIISSGERGYKIPCNVSDLREYVKTTDSKVVPMLQRVLKANNAIRMATTNSLNLVQESGSNELKAIIDLLNKGVSK